MSALAKTSVGSIAKSEEWTAEQIQVLKNTVARGTSDAEFKLFGEVCRTTGLNPFAKQIYAIMRNQYNPDTKRKEPRMVIQTSIDGFRLIAERTRLYGGQGMFEWCGADGVWKDVWLSDQQPLAARATVYRKDWDRPLTRVALMSAYQQLKYEGGPTEMWSGGKGVGQLAKCAEALVLRAAFPQELSGLYTSDEMAQADNEPVRATVVARAPAAALPAANKPASVPPPAAEPPPENTAAARFQWKASDEWNGKPLVEAPTDVVIEYSDYLAAVVSQYKGQKAAKQAAKFLLEAEAEIALRMKVEGAAAQMVDVGGALQAMVDKAHPAEDDAAGSWLDPEAT